MEPYDELKARVDEHGPGAVAKQLGISRQAIWNILNGVHGIGDDLAETLGFEKIVVYRKRERAA